MHGKPEAIPFHSNESVSRRAGLGLLDYSARLVAGATLADLDPRERARLRDCIRTHNGDVTLLKLSDGEGRSAVGSTMTKVASASSAAAAILFGPPSPAARIPPARWTRR